MFTTDKLFTNRQWVEKHYPDFYFSPAACARLGRELAPVIAQHTLRRPRGSYKRPVNKYRLINHDTINQVFRTMRDAGLLTTQKEALNV